MLYEFGSGSARLIIGSEGRIFPPYAAITYEQFIRNECGEIRTFFPPQHTKEKIN